MDYSTYGLDEICPASISNRIIFCFVVRSVKDFQA